MKLNVSQHQMRRVNIDFNFLNNQPHKKDEEGLALCYKLREQKRSNFKSILEKVCEAHRKQQKGVYDPAKDNHHQQKIQRQTMDFSDLRRNRHSLKKHPSFQLKRPEITAGTIQHIQEPNEEPSDDRGRRTAMTRFHELHGNLDQSQQKQKASPCPIDPYTKKKYRYIKNNQIDSDLSLRSSCSNRKFRNSITRSYKVSGILLAPRESQPRFKYLGKTVNDFTISSSLKKRAFVERKDSAVLPWEWKEQAKFDLV